MIDYETQFKTTLYQLLMTTTLVLGSVFAYRTYAREEWLDCASNVITVSLAATVLLLMRKGVSTETSSITAGE